MNAWPPPQAPQVTAAPRPAFYRGWRWQHWTLLIVGVVILAVVLGPMWLTVLLGGF